MKSAGFQTLDQLLQAGIIAAKSGQLEQARFQLLDVVERDQTNETAWYWLYQVFDREDDKRICLENLILINPANQWAKQELLNRLEAAPSASARLKIGKIRRRNSKPVDHPAAAVAGDYTTRPLSLKLVIAFWAGISIIFLSSGIIAAGDWFIEVLNSRNFPYGITVAQFLELLIAISFLASGVSGFFIAATLFLRSMIGFYGSILLALGLLLIGPTMSLISTPPNYLSLVCTGGVSGMIVLLTLAGQPGFKNPSQDDQPTNPNSA
jgi:hypothetical protein